MFSCYVAHTTESSKLSPWKKSLFTFPLCCITQASVPTRRDAANFWHQQRNFNKGISQFNFFFVTLHQISLGPNRTGWGKLGTKKSLCRYAALLKPQFRQIQQTVSTKKKTSRHKKFHCLVKGAMTTNASLVHKKDCLVGITLTPLLTWNSLE